VNRLPDGKSGFFGHRARNQPQFPLQNWNSPTLRDVSGTEPARLSIFMVKVKCTLLQAPWLCTGRAAHGGSRGIALPFLDHGTRRGWGVSVTPRPLFTLEKDPVPIVQEAGWAPGPVWTGAENLAPTGIQSPDRPARSQSLYRLRYPAHWIFMAWSKLAHDKTQRRLLWTFWFGKSKELFFLRVNK